MATKSLRELIIETIAHSGYASRIETKKSLEETAAYIGVLPETLIEARERRNFRQLETGKDEKSGRISAGNYQYYTATYQLPHEVLIFWMEYSKKRGILPATFVRSAIHAYLQSDYEPEMPGSMIVVNGVPYSGNRKNGKANITYAAKLLLEVRAQARNARTLTLLNAILVDVMNGKFCAPGTFELVGRSQMFSDPTRYRAPTGSAGVPRNMTFEGQAPRERMVEAFGDIEEILPIR